MTSSTAVHSNAFNFMSFIENGVDPRTGLYTLAINLPSLTSHDLNGPELALSLNYNPLNSQNSGYGLGWDLKLSQFMPATRVLSLSTGETFKSSRSTQGRMVFNEQKLDTFRCFEDGAGWYRVVHKSGTVELLQELSGAGPTIALPRYIESQKGHRLTLQYAPFGDTQRLVSISDGTQILLGISMDPGGRVVHIDQRPGAGEQQGPWARYTLRLGADDRVERITLPSSPASSWRFSYEIQRGLLCLKTIGSPTGSLETLKYEDAGHVFPGGAGSDPGRPMSAHERLTFRRLTRDETPAKRANREKAAALDTLPRVTWHTTDPGFGQPPIEVKYTYELNGAPSIHNFLGGGLRDVVYEDDGFDNLYKTTTQYEYGTVETLMVANQPVRHIARTFNRYHLLVEEKTTQGACIQEVLTTYHINEDLPFDLQPAYVQLPATVRSIWRKTDSNDYEETVERTEFDPYGNPTLSVAITGVEEFSSWYPAEGGDGCPPDPHGFVRQLCERRTVPASSDYSTPTRVARYRYVACTPVTQVSYPDGQVPPVTGAAQSWLALGSEWLGNLEGDTAIELQISVSDYVQAPDDLMRHGREATIRTSFAGQTTFPVDAPPLTLGGHTSVTAYQYEKLAATQRLRTTETLTTFDSLSKVLVREASLITGTTLIDEDDNNIRIETRYNALDQVISETAAPGTEEAATRYYAYQLVDEHGGQAKQTVTDVKNVQTRTWFDGLNRAIREERQLADTPARADTFMQTYGALYDAMGQLASDTLYDARLGAAPVLPGVSFGPGEWDWLGHDPLVLKTSYTYDDWGQQCAATGPDGVEEHEQNDPSTRTTTSWRSGIGKTVTRNNRFDQPLSVERQNLADDRYSIESCEYDGLGRLCKSTDALTRVTTFAYDVYDRLVSKVLPGGAEVQRDYAVHTSEDLPIAIRVVTRSKTFELGSQVFDGLSRLTWSITGNRATHNLYEGSHARPAVVKTPAGERIAYTYKPHLSDEPVQRAIEGQPAMASYDLDPHNARLRSGSESGHTFHREYFSTGELKSESRSAAEGDREMGYVYSLAGRLLCYYDVLAIPQVNSYDLEGRLVATQLGTTRTTLTYNASGLNDGIDTRDTELGKQVKVTLAFDHQGRESLRTFDLGDNLVQTLSQQYNVLDQMTHRTLKEGDQMLRDESYAYDVRDRLSSYDVEGSEAPFDPAGHQIVSQAFYCDAIDNHEEVLTIFRGAQGIEENDALYEYSQEDPAQLIRITNDHPIYAAALDMELTYDANGCLLVDEAGRRLQYDALSRLVAVHPPEGDSLEYRYDALDMIYGAAEEERFYCAGQLVSLIDPASQARTIMRAGEALVAEHQAPYVKPA